jgi:hypothetical protein
MDFPRRASPKSVSEPTAINGGTGFGDLQPAFHRLGALNVNACFRIDEQPRALTSSRRIR